MDRSFLRNTSILTLSSVLSPLASLALVLTLARLRGPGELGAYSVAMGVFLVAESLAALGLGVVSTREVARAPHTAGAHFVAGCTVGAGLLAPLLAVGVPALLWWGSGAPAVSATALLAVAVLPSVVTGFGTAIFLGLECVTDFVAVDLAEKCARALVGGALIWAGGGVVALAWLILALRVAAAGAYVGRLRRRGVEIRPRFDRRLCGHLLRHVPVTGAIPLLNAIYSRVDVFMLGWLGSLDAVGYYGAALRVVDVSRTVPSAFGRALYPQMARLAAGSSADLLREARAASRHLSIAVGALILVVGGLAEAIVPTLFGTAFAPAAPTLRVLVWAVAPYALACVLSNVLFATNHQAADLRVNLVCIACAPLLQALLIPRHGVIGAALATGGAAVLYAALQYRAVAALVAAPRLGSLIGRLLVALAVAAGAPVALAGGGSVWGSALSLTAYLVACLGLGLVTRRDGAQLRRLLDRSHARRLRQVA